MSNDIIDCCETIISRCHVIAGERYLRACVCASRYTRHVRIKTFKRDKAVSLHKHVNNGLLSRPNDLNKLTFISDFDLRNDLVIYAEYKR